MSLLLNKISLVVPCYNEQDNIFSFYQNVKQVFGNQPYDYEVIFVDDGSSDKTHLRLDELWNENKRNIAVLSLSRNFGKEAAVYAGLKKSSGDIVAIIDADLQQRPERLLQMVKILEGNAEYDSIAAYQSKRDEGKFISFLKNAFYKVINKVSEVDFYSGASDFRVMKRSMVEAIIEMSEYHRFSKGIFSWVGFKTYYMEYTVEKRNSGDSKWSLKSLFKYALEGIIAFTTFPLKIAIYLGTILSFVSFIYMVIVIGQKLFFEIEVPGFATIIVVILFLGGIQLFILGIIGEYLARIYIQVKNRPIYILKSTKEVSVKKKDNNVIEIA